MKNRTLVPSSSSNHTVSSSLSKNHSASRQLNYSRSPFLVDFATCNHQRLWKSVTRNLRKYLTCFNPTRSKHLKDKGKPRMISSHASTNTTTTPSVHSLRKNCNYYSQMNDQERDEKLESAIIYCKDSTTQDDDQHKGTLIIDELFSSTLVEEES